MNAADRVEMALANPRPALADTTHPRHRLPAVPARACPRPAGACRGSIVPRGPPRHRQHARAVDRDTRAPAGTCSRVTITGVSATFPNGGMPTLTSSRTTSSTGWRRAVSRGFGLAARLPHRACCWPRRTGSSRSSTRRSSAASTVVAVLRAIFVGSGTKQEPAQSDLEMLARDRRELRRRLLGRGRRALPVPLHEELHAVQRRCAGGRR